MKIKRVVPVKSVEGRLAYEFHLETDDKGQSTIHIVVKRFSLKPVKVGESEFRRTIELLTEPFKDSEVKF